MWRSKNGPCICFYCERGILHPDHRDRKGNVIFTWGERGHLQVAESLDPKDIVHTRVCSLCSHEEMVIGTTDGEGADNIAVSREDLRLVVHGGAEDQTQLDQAVARLASALSENPCK